MLRGCVGFALCDFDARVTAYYCGFTGVDDYYARSAAANVIDRVAKPTRVIHAVNDPFIRILPETTPCADFQSQHYLH
jgi:predicted alpha/beta-fold hydrolase